MVARTLAETYRHFGESPAARDSPLYQRVAAALSGSGAALRAVTAAPARRRQPALILAALHDLALAGHAPALAAAYAAGDAAAAAEAAVATLAEQGEAVVAIAARRRLHPDQTGRYAVLHPLVAEAARRAGADRVGLIDVGRAAGLNLQVDRVGITYGDGPVLGDPTSPVQVGAAIVGDARAPARALPPVAARIGLHADPADVTDPGEARWLRAGLAPERTTSAAEVALAATAPPVLLRGDPVARLPDALARVPAGALPVVLTTWVLSQVPVERRRHFLQHLEEAAAGRAVAWVSAEGVGVAPAVPTFGDRPASGHSILGLAVGDRSPLRVEAVGRCWSRGRLLAWLARAA